MTDKQMPDLDWIKKNVPVHEMARRLGVELHNSKRAHCWRKQNHNRGDADPSLTFQPRRNIARCWVCDLDGPMSNVDLAMKVKGWTLPQAIAWIAQEWPEVPRIPHWRRLPRSVERLDTASLMDFLSRTGMWAELTPAEQGLLPVLLAFRDPKSCTTRMSYVALMKQSGLGSPRSVARAIRRLGERRLLRVERGWEKHGIRKVNVYRLTPEDPEFLAQVDKVSRQRASRAETERIHRELARGRKRVVRTMDMWGQTPVTPCTPTCRSSTLYPQDSGRADSGGLSPLPAEVVQAAS